MIGTLLLALTNLSSLFVYSIDNFINLDLNKIANFSTRHKNYFMKTRRDFLKQTGTFTAGSILLPSFAKTTKKVDNTGNQGLATSLPKLQCYDA